MAPEDSGYMIGMDSFWWLLWVGVVAIAIGAAIIFKPWRSPKRRGNNPLETPRDELRRKLTAGEITTEEFEQRKAVLDRDSSDVN